MYIEKMQILDAIADYTGRRYIYVEYLLYVLYIIVFIGIVQINPVYIHDLRWIMQVFICTFLIYRFNPLRTHVLTKYDASIIFSSAIFLLINTGMVEIFERYVQASPIGIIINDITK
jgi:hypothetical protein